MAIFHTCCFCCIMRTGAFVSGLYSLLGTLFYLILLVIRNIGFDLVDKYKVHEALTYTAIVILAFLMLASILLTIGVPTDRLNLYVPWLLMAPISVLYTSIALCYTIVYDLRNDIPVEGWEYTLVVVHVINSSIMVVCIVCVSCQAYDLYRGKGSAEYYREVALTRQQTLAAMFGIDTDVDDMGVAGVHGVVGPMEPPGYLGVPPPAYSELSSRRTNPRSREDRNNQSEPNPSSDRGRSEQQTSNATPSRSRPRPSPSGPGSDITDQAESVESPEASTIGRGGGRASTSAYLSFEAESEDGGSTMSRPTTLVRDQAVARIMVEGPITETPAEDSQTPSTANDNTTNENSNTAQETEPRSREESSSRSRTDANDESENIQGREASNNNDDNGAEGGGDTVGSPEENSPTNEEDRPPTPVIDYTLEHQRNRSSRNRRVPQDPEVPERPPPYSAHGPMYPRRPSQQDVLAQNYVRRPSRHDDLEAMARMRQPGPLLMRQRSRDHLIDHSNNWYGPEMHPREMYNPNMVPAPREMYGPEMYDPRLHRPEEYLPGGPEILVPAHVAMTDPFYNGAVFQ